MTIILFIVMLAFVVFSARKAILASQKISSVSEFYSFGDELDPSAVRRAFQATNISFTTSFLALYLFSFSLGLFTLITPLCFCLGIVIYAFFFLPRQMTVLASGDKYPELLAKATGTPKLRTFIAIFVIFSLWMFTFAEIQGLHLFLGQLFKDIPIIVQSIPIILIGSVAFYVSRNGYSATTSNDIFQMRLIFVGAISIILLVGIFIFRVGVDNVKNIITNIGNPFGTSRGIFMAICETFFGFAFSQLLYYDNWQRLSFWVQAKMKTEEMKNSTGLDRKMKLYSMAKSIRKEYLLGSIPMMIVFCAPILLGLATLTSGASTGNLATLSDFFRTSWNQIPFIGPILVTLSFLFMLSALISTAESYVIAMSNCIVEDILKISIKRTSDDSANEKKDHLEAVRMLTAVLVVTIIPILLIRPNFDNLFVYLFYSANGFVGPLLVMAYNRNIALWSLMFSIIFGFLYPAIPLLTPQFSNFAPYPGLVPVVVSIILVFALSKPKKEINYEF